MRLLATLEREGVVVKVYRDVEYNEYNVKLYLLGMFIEDSTYFTDDKGDAFGTADEIFKFYNNQIVVQYDV